MMRFMDVWESAGQLFEVVMASDLIRDGMVLELTDLAQDASPGPVLEIFWSDVDNTFTFLAHRPAQVPMDILTRFVESARQRLPPTNRSDPE